MLVLLSAEIIVYFTDSWSSANSSISDRHEVDKRCATEMMWGESQGELQPCESSLLPEFNVMIHSVTVIISFPLGRSRGFSLHSVCSGKYTGGLRLHQRLPAEHFCTRRRRAGRAERGVHRRRWLQIGSDQDQVCAGGLSCQRRYQGEKRVARIEEEEEDWLKTDFHNCCTGVWIIPFKLHLFTQKIIKEAHHNFPEPKVK